MRKTPKHTPANKTEAIRRFMSENPTLGPKAVAEAVTEQGFPCKAGYVSVIKANGKKARAKNRMAKASRFTAALPAAPPTPKNDGRALDAILVLFKAAKGHGVGNVAIEDAVMTLLNALA